MKTSVFRLPLLLAVAAAFLPLAAHAAPPALSLQKAIELAQQSLASKGAQNDTYIQSISLERSTVLSPRAVWVITWSSTIPGSREGTKESGLEINMQGEVVHLIGGHGKKKANSPH